MRNKANALLPPEVAVVLVLMVSGKRAVSFAIAGLSSRLASLVVDRTLAQLVSVRPDTVDVPDSLAKSLLDLSKAFCLSYMLNELPLTL